MSLPNLDKMIDRYKNKDEDLDYAIKNSEVSKHISPLENHRPFYKQNFISRPFLPS